MRRMPVVTICGWCGADTWYWHDIDSPRDGFQCEVCDTLNIRVEAAGRLPPAQ